MASVINQIKTVLLNKRLLEVAILGIFSGMPLAVISTTLTTWLKESGYSIELVTTIAIARLPYSLKYLWAPIVDYHKLPVIGTMLGRRKSWMILCIIIISSSLMMMSTINPIENYRTVYALAILIGISSATFDISFDAFRIDNLSTELQGIGAACAVYGYRIGILISSGWALYFAHFKGWEITFMILSGIYLLGIIFTLVAKEIQVVAERKATNHQEYFTQIILKPFQDFFARKYAVTILAGIILYKLGEVLLGSVSTPFFLELGYIKPQIAIIVKGLGLIATLTGTYAGGLVLYYTGNIKGLIICGILQMVSNVSFIWLHHQPVSDLALLITICVENFTGGMGSVALVAFLSILCNKQYSATQYALLSSFASLMNNTISTQSGKLVTIFGWDQFYILTIIVSLPALFIFSYLHYKMDSRENDLLASKSRD